jgi:hypothetical protein
MREMLDAKRPQLSALSLSKGPVHIILVLVQDAVFGQIWQ